LGPWFGGDGTRSLTSVDLGEAAVVDRDVLDLVVEHS
jgi:hypothetical protein